MDRSGKSPRLQEETDVYDVIVVGGGPAGLAVSARLREDTPAAIFTDEEHRRYQWLRKHGKRVSVKQVKTGKEMRYRRPSSSDETVSDASGDDDGDHGDHGDHSTHGIYDNSYRRYADHRTRMLVVDASDSQWMGRWNRLFGAYCIQHLRSPLLWHVDPQDRDSLLARAHEEGTPDDLFDIGACVGKEVSKHLKKKRSARRGGIQDSQPNVDINERDRNDYFTPSRGLFWDHCNSVRDRYGLAGILRKETLCDVDYGVVRGVSTADERLFTVTTDTTRRYARVVILAVGPANVATIPRIPGLPWGMLGDSSDGSSSSLSSSPTMAWARQLDNRPVDGELLWPQACHTFHLRRIPDAVVEARIRARQTTNVLVVGGGLTAAQVTDILLRRGVTRVWLLMRGSVVVKYFDVGLNWMGKYKNREQARFWSAENDEERMEIVREARGGGSITPQFNKILKKHVAAGRVRLHTQTVVTRLDFRESAGQRGESALARDPGTTPPRPPGHWHVQTSPPIPDLPPMDYIYFATGIETDVERLPYLQTMLHRFPIDTVGGYPCLNEDLMWADDVPLFCTGKLAMLRVGPAAPNIGGVKIGAERVALAVESVLRRSSSRDVDNNGDSDEYSIPRYEADYATGVGSKYKCLGEE